MVEGLYSTERLLVCSDFAIGWLKKYLWDFEVYFPFTEKAFVEK